MSAFSRTFAKQQRPEPPSVEQELREAIDDEVKYEESRKPTDPAPLPYEMQMSYTAVSLARMADLQGRMTNATERLAESTEELVGIQSKRLKLEASPPPQAVASRAAAPPSSTGPVISLSTVREQGLFQLIKETATSIDKHHDDLFDWQSYYLSRPDAKSLDSTWIARHVYPNIRYIRFAVQFALAFIRIRTARPRLMLAHILIDSKSRSVFSQMVVDVYANVKVHAGYKYSPVSNLKHQAVMFEDCLKWFSRRESVRLDQPLSSLHIAFTPWEKSNSQRFGTDPIYASFLQLCCEATNHALPDMNMNSNVLPYLRRLRSNTVGFHFESSCNLTLTQLADQTQSSMERVFDVVIQREDLLVVFVHWLACHYYVTKQIHKSTDAREEVTQRIVQVCMQYAEWVVRETKRVVR